MKTKTLHETLHCGRPTVAEQDERADMGLLTIGAHVRIVVGNRAGDHAIIIGHDVDGIVAPWEVRPEGWPRELPGLMFEADELEVEDADINVWQTPWEVDESRWPQGLKDMFTSNKLEY